MSTPTEAGTPHPGNHRTCLILALVGAGLALVTCIALVLLGILFFRAVPVDGPGRFAPYEFQGPAEHSAPDVRATLRVLEDGCTVERSEVTGPDAVRAVMWVVADASGNVLLERGADGEFRYRYYRPGTYTVTLKAYFGGRYWTVSDPVAITCP